ncbi:HNH endonuclease family protein [Actinosynnema sp. NPDC020468]|uniref:HNH endonuclease family protein n=1 Tax=Actinosynnema sp. NPDC020468 TaxID=3154488 RepID=UPI0033C692A2
MSRTRSTTLTSAVVLVLLVVVGYYLSQYRDSTAPQGTPAPTAASPVPAGDAAAKLAALVVAPEAKMTGYSRDRFPHWSGQGNSCDTREVVLQRQGKDVKTDAECKATSGTWTSVYDDKVVTDAKDLDIDHTVPLAEAWRSGADKWTDEQRQKLANDLGGQQLIAVTANTNRAKGDQDPAKWMPPAAGYACKYVSDWIAVKSAYALTVDQAEHDALAKILAGC